LGFEAGRPTSPQPFANVVRHLPQRDLGDVLTIHRSHVPRGRHVTHDVINGDLITGLRSDGFERPPQTVEAKPSERDRGLLHRLLHRGGHGVMHHDLRLSVA
jgi:hypothetical protein